MIFQDDGFSALLNRSLKQPNSLHQISNIEQTRIPIPWIWQRITNQKPRMNKKQKKTLCCALLVLSQVVVIILLALAISGAFIPGMLFDFSQIAQHSLLFLMWRHRYPNKQSIRKTCWSVGGFHQSVWWRREEQRVQTLVHHQKNRTKRERRYKDCS